VEPISRTSEEVDPMAARIGEINVMCTDLDAALAFYRDAMGLAEVEREGDAVRLDLGAIDLLLLPFAQEVLKPSARTAGIGFDIIVDDIDVVDDLVGAGGTRVEPLEEGAGWVVADPDGNLIEIIEEDVSASA
jgi:catechol 2,3-dioxygenase-like lactoylglutathione lyase family enzyme